MYGGNRLWESLVALGAILLEEKVDLDEIDTQIEKKKSDETRADYDRRIAAAGGRKPGPKITFLDSKISNSIQDFNSCRATVNKRSREEEEGTTLKSKKRGKILNFVPNLDLRIAANHHLSAEDPVKKHTERSREVEEDEISQKRRKILLLHHRLILDRDGADEDRTWKKSIRKFVRATDSSKSCPKIKYINPGRALNPIGEDFCGLNAKMRRQILDCGGFKESALLVIQKKLFATDVDTKQCRLSIPHTQIKKAFLNKLYPDEAARLDSTAEGIPVTFLAQEQEQRMSLRNWKSNKIYALVGGWIQICVMSGLEAGKSVQLWCFRRNNLELCFILNQLD